MEGTAGVADTAEKGGEREGKIGAKGVLARLEGERARLEKRGASRETMRPLTSVATSGCSSLLPTQALQAFQACSTATTTIATTTTTTTTTILSSLLAVPAILAVPAATPPSRCTTTTRVDEHDDDVAGNCVSAVDNGGCKRTSSAASSLVN